MTISPELLKEARERAIEEFEQFTHNKDLSSSHAVYIQVYFVREDGRDVIHYIDGEPDFQLMTHFSCDGELLKEFLIRRVKTEVIERLR